jgi:hypothetical protein
MAFFDFSFVCQPLFPEFAAHCAFFGRRGAGGQGVSVGCRKKMLD